MKTIKYEDTYLFYLNSAESQGSAKAIDMSIETFEGRARIGVGMDDGTRFTSTVFKCDNIIREMNTDVLVDDAISLRSAYPTLSAEHINLLLSPVGELSEASPVTIELA